MFFWFTPVLYLLAAAPVLAGLIMGFARRRPGDLVFGSILLLQLGLLGQLFLTIAAGWFNNHPRGDLVEFYLYLISALLMPAAAGVYVFFDRTIWGNFIFAAVAIALLVMIYRMQVIWG